MIFGGVALLVLLPFILPLIPGFVNALANKPNVKRIKTNESIAELNTQDEDEIEPIVTVRVNTTDDYKPHTLAFFTFLEPGRAKIIERGDRFIRILMRYDDHSFRGETSLRTKTSTGKDLAKGPIARNEAAFWDVIKTPKGELDTHPISTSLRRGHFDLVWLWSRYVYRITGAVFTGIPPFQTVRTYKLSRLLKVPAEKGGYDFEVETDYSDHFRASYFQFFVRIDEAETQDQAPLDIDFAATLRVQNPYQTAYEAADWSTQFTTALTNVILNHIRGLTRSEVTAEDTSDASYHAKRLSSAGMRINKGDKTSHIIAIPKFGLKMDKLETLSIKVADKELKEALAGIAKSEARATARVNEGDAEAAAQGALMKKAATHGRFGELVVTTERDVRTAKAAGVNGGSVIVNTGGQQGGVDSKTAFLRESLERINP